jgi:hypothetical protein
MLFARFRGRCAVTGAPIAIGDAIRRVGRSRYALVSRATRAVDPVEPIDADIALAESIDPGCSADDPDAAAHAGAYLRRSMAHGVSDIWRGSTGREYYRNRRGLCEDAPCCGCCNA